MMPEQAHARFQFVTVRSILVLITTNLTPGLSMTISWIGTGLNLTREDTTVSWPRGHLLYGLQTMPGARDTAN
jgi:hypothetical protein